MTISPRIRSAFTFYDVEGANKTTSRLKTMQNSGVPGGSKYTYVYDKLGRITRITETKDGIDKTIDYTYDELSQLTREINEVTGQQVDYVYDLGGNIVSKTITDLATNETTVVPYTYDSAWKDKMASFDGKAITYDAIGNPLTYDGDNYAWTQGRKLQSITGNGKNIRYSYTNDGMRLYKLVNGVRTNFYYDAGRLVGQQTGGVNTFFYYNGDDELVGLEHGGEVYYFTKNAQGDIVGIYDKQGALQAQYVYDTWGKVVAVQDADGNEITDPNHIGHANPIRYRGYYYDNETGYYYLQTRFYNPEWGRFLNADAIAGIVGIENDHNVFSYCKNNPVNCTDPLGLYCGRDEPAIVAQLGPCPSCSGNSNPGKTTQMVEVALSAAAGGAAVKHLSTGSTKQHDLGKGWELLHHGGHNQGDPEHQHLKYRNKEVANIRYNGKPHHENKDTKDPPDKIKKKIKELTGWDWDELRKGNNIDAITPGYYDPSIYIFPINPGGAALPSFSFSPGGLVFCY
ncbi:MAG: RHS repeat domain-containing protein [Oscillospiraceae bacterium]